jgi:hypothetical protein
MTEQDETGGGPALPPYEGRKKSADVGPADEGREGGVAVGGARRPTETDDELRRAEPEQTPGGAVASPAEERPAADEAAADREAAAPEEASTGPAHQAGVPRGEAQ